MLKYQHPEQTEDPSRTSCDHWRIQIARSPSCFNGLDSLLALHFFFCHVSPRCTRCLSHYIWHGWTQVTQPDTATSSKWHFNLPESNNETRYLQGFFFYCACKPMNNHEICALQCGGYFTNTVDFKKRSWKPFFFLPFSQPAASYTLLVLHEHTVSCQSLFLCMFLIGRGS